jgi:hypothetical protein
VAGLPEKERDDQSDHDDPKRVVHRALYFERPRPLAPARGRVNRTECSNRRQYAMNSRYAMRCRQAMKESAHQPQ